MKWWSGIHQGAEAINILLSSEERNLAARKEEYKAEKKIAVIGTVIILGICIGVMYIRFRVLGG